MRSLLPENPSRRVPSETTEGELEPLREWPGTGPWLSFHYSSTEVSRFAGQTRVKSKRVQYENGRSKTEEFEGTLGAEAFDSMVAESQRFFMNQTLSLLRQVSLFFPGIPKK
jgi:hypothetical protein